MYVEVNTLLKSLPDAIDIGMEAPAFPASAASEVMELAEKNQWVILGGDVLTTRQAHAYANWYYEPDKNLSLMDHVKHSVLKAKQYISHYAERNGDDFLLVFTISNSYVSGR